MTGQRCRAVSSRPDLLVEQAEHPGSRDSGGIETADATSTPPITQTEAAEQAVLRLQRDLEKLRRQLYGQKSERDRTAITGGRKRSAT